VSDPDKASPGKSDLPRQQPVFVDNRGGNTLARAITTHLESLRQRSRTVSELCVASGYFNPQGLELLASEARHLPSIRLHLGAEPTPGALLPNCTPFNLSPDLLFPVIDATTEKRTRRLIKKHYASDLIRGADGRMTPPPWI
jgi:hypothetical protein